MPPDCFLHSNDDDGDDGVSCALGVLQVLRAAVTHVFLVGAREDSGGLWEGLLFPRMHDTVPRAPNWPARLIGGGASVKSVSSDHTATLHKILQMFHKKGNIH